MAQFPEYKREFHYTSELAENKVYMLLGLPIGTSSKNEPFIVGAIFAEEMYFWKKVGYEICVKINCPGGRIIDGFSIMDAVRETKATTQCVGIAASMAMPILLSGSHRSAYDYAKGMIHPPAGDDKNAVEMMRDSLSTILNNLSDFKKDKIEAMLKDGAGDTWLDAKAMLKHGLISEIIKTEQTVAEETDPYALYEVYNQLIATNMAENKDPENPAMKTILELQTKVNENAQAAKAKDDEIAELKAQLKGIEDKAKADKEAAGKLLVENAIKSKSITIPVDKPGLRAEYEKMAIDSPEAFKALVESTKPVQRTSVVAHMSATQTAVGVASVEDSYEDLANNNPKKLYEIMENDPETYNKLVAKWHEKARTQKIA